MHRLMIILFLSFSSGLTQAAQKDLPVYIEKCSLKRDFRECVIRSAIKTIPSIVKGDPEYNVPSMQPFVVPFISPINTPQLVLNLTDTKVYGLENAKIVDLISQTNDTDLFINPTFQIRNVTLNGEFSVAGNVLAFALNGKGLYTASLVNGVYKYPFYLKKVKFNGVEYYQARAKAMQFDFDDVLFDLSNIFNGDPEFGKQVNKLLTENWRILIDEFRPTITEIITNIVTGVFNKIAMQVPANKIFLPD